MACYAALVSAVQSLKEIIDGDQYSKFFLDKQQIASVYEKLSHLETSLENYSPKDEEAADCLERRIRDAAYQLQDILESQQYKSSNLISSQEKFHRINTVLPHLIPSWLYRAMPRQHQNMEKVKEEVDSIVQEVTRMKIKKCHTAEELELTNNHSASEQKQTGCGDNTVGFEEQRTTIIEQLFEESSNLLVVPLVGMGGIGKTTLARSIFDEKLIGERFDRRAWVTVSQNYHMRKLLLDFLDSMNVDTEDLRKADERLLKEREDLIKANEYSLKEREDLIKANECSLKERIYKHLKGWRYLIILDDIWHTNFWDDMKMILPDDSNGSRIILTARLSNVAVYANRRGNLHQMQFLNEDQSWNLLREKVFAQENCPPELEVIGRLIAKNCRGLPLAIVVVAGLLSKVNKARYDWEEIARNVISAATENDEHFSKILSLSYNQLPHHLKPCFLYMGGFPEDYLFSISRLIKLWIAEGFLKPGESKSLEETGEEYFEDLVERNLVLITKKKSNGKFKYCVIHDVLRDLCVKRARYENFLHVVNEDGDYLYTQATMNIIRRLCIHHDPSQLKAKEFGSRIGSILCFGFIDGYYIEGKLLSFAWGFKRLRVLNAQEVMFSLFPSEVWELSRLRFLALRFDEDELEIPPRISKLQNLQIFIIGTPGEIAGISFPFQFWEMPNLRHVDAFEMMLSTSFPFACILENLQTLSEVRDFKFTNRAIQMIPNLKRLKVLYTSVEPKDIWDEYCLCNLVQLCQLEALYISFVFDYELPFPEYFAFPHKLKKLSLEGCQIPWKDMTVVGSLSNLQVLILLWDAFVGDKWEPVEGEFTQMKVLVMKDLDLKYWRAEIIHFPRLEHLQIASCRSLQEIPFEIGDIPTLELIEVFHCDRAEASALEIQKEQQDLGNDVLQVRVEQMPRGSGTDFDVDG